MATEVSTPPISRASSSSSAGTKRRHSPNLSIDLSDLPQLSQPATPSNTLLITNLSDPLIFSETNLTSIRDAISAQALLYSFSPLKSFRRIIAVFHSTESAISVRQLLDGESVLGHRIRVYFGEPTETEERDRHLAAPQSQKLFFISPPPSPPMGWEMRNEEPPNKEVHAEDLASALHSLTGREGKKTAFGDVNGNALPSPGAVLDKEIEMGGVRRSRSSTIVFDPERQGRGTGADLPAIAVEDVSDDEGGLGEEDEEMAGRKPMVHTARPPVELME